MGKLFGAMGTQPHHATWGPASGFAGGFSPKGWAAAPWEQLLGSSPCLVAQGKGASWLPLLPGPSLLLASAPDGGN